MIITDLGFYKTRGGDKVEVVAIRDQFAIVHNGDGLAYTVNITTGTQPFIPSFSHILSEWQEPKPPVVFEGWINIYSNAFGWCRTADWARESKLEDCIETLHIRYDSSKPTNEKIQVIGE